MICRAKFDSAWRCFPLALVLGCSIYAMGFCLFGHPGDLTWADTAAIVRQAYARGDAVTTIPWWAAGAREQLGDLDFIQVRDIEHEDLSHFARLWVLSLPGHHRLAGPFADGTYTSINTIDIGGLQLGLWKLGKPVTVAYNFRKNLDKANVSMVRTSGLVPCSRWTKNRWICSSHDWNYVGRVTVEMGDDPRRVIWAHPVENGRLQILYSNVPAGKTLMVHTGLTPPGARTPDGAPVYLDVELDGKPLGSIVQQNKTGYFPHSIDISASGPGPHQFVFTVHAARIGMRHFCFQAEVLR